MTALDTTAESHVKPLGIVRWVQVAFMGLALFLLWLLDKIATLVWQMFAEPNPTLVSVGAALVGGLTSVVLYRNARVHQVTSDVLGELTKVTWPSRRETQAATIVVIIASVIAAVIIGVLDAAWSAVTDVIY
jgi:preprotein translocase subunit SecE